MKNPGNFVLVMITVLFIGFTCGFFVGRNLDHAEIQISKQPDQTQASSSHVTPTSTPETVPFATGTPTGTVVPEIPTVPSPPAGEKININTATKEELMALPGIGEVLAANIIAYREAHGAYKSVAELLHISGIGEKRLEAIYDLITV